MNVLFIAVKADSEDIANLPNKLKELGEMVKEDVAKQLSFRPNCMGKDFDYEIQHNVEAASLALLFK